MFLLRRPTESQLAAIYERYRKLPFTYTELGGTLGKIPAGFQVDHNRARLGSGEAVYEAAKDAIRDWQMFRLGWVEPSFPNEPVEVGALVGTTTNLTLCWSVNVCRVVQVVDEVTDDGARFGFAYGTLPGHVGRGEERFLVEYDRRDDSVWYDILAFSQPGSWILRVGYPMMRIFQRRFGRDSKQSMRDAVRKKVEMGVGV